MLQSVRSNFGIRAPSAFFAATGELERRPLRLAAFLLIAAPTVGAVALVVGLFLTACAAHGFSAQQGVSFLDAFTTLLSDRAGRRSLLSYWYELSVAGLASYAAGVALLGLAARIYRRPTRSFLVAGPRFRWRLVGSGFLIGLVTVGLAIATQYIWEKPPSPAPLFQSGETLATKLGYAGMAAICLYLAALAEEIVFRGVVLQVTGAFTQRLVVILAINGVIFSLAHFDPDPSAFVIRIFMGAGWAWIALRTAGIEVTTGVHLANNLLISLFVAPVSFSPATAHKLDPAAVAVELATVLLAVLGVELLVRRRERAAVLGAPAPLAAASQAE